MEEKPKEIPGCYEEDEIDLVELWQTIWSHRKFIGLFTLSITILAVILTLTMTNIYKSQAVLLPSKSSASPLGSLSSIASIVGVSIPSSSGSAEIMSLLKSNVLKEEVIKRYNLLPVLLYKSWDEKHHRWRQPSKFALFITKIKAAIGLSKGKSKKNGPDIDDGIRALNNIFDVSEDRKLGTINVSVEYPDPKMAQKILEDIISTLREHMTSEAIRIAKKKINLLNQQLNKTTDPTIQQMIYKLIANQMKILTTAEVSENFAFKVIDPPFAPDRKYKPKRKLIVIVAFITALILSIFIVFFVEFIKSAKERMKEKELEVEDKNEASG